MAYYSDSDLDQMANAVYDQVQQRLDSDATHTRERERGTLRKVRRSIRQIIEDVTTFLFGRIIGSIVGLVLGWILD